MATDDTDEHQVDDGSGDRLRDDPDDALERTESEVFEAESDGVRTTAVEEVDQRIVDLLSWILDTETRAKIYVHLLAHPGSTSEEVAKGTGLYPSTVREALAELHDEDRVTREKRASEGAGNNPYEYTAIQPSELVGGVVDQVQRELNTIFTLDRHTESEASLEEGSEPVTITVNETAPTEPADESDDTDASRTDDDR
ncbi:helix-turn-helix domain-containing protein [Natronorubrum aibiense]|uniref:Winged helix-turn-helix transcriptional regulator n=1 Tax=Natronorubrum aibiense TaxID=348826 RepID=A0A5P9P6U8_9EURY|nr:helix-turn-helix domain-containing protein [Natronorubrum aibiense]QFU83862.1 winged helix-turn-helix transcriptional regulator [Natronorubrum aibiense]